MSIADSILLGLVQGLLEFIPVSSSGHLILLDKLTSVESSFAFDVLINIGTLGALVWYFKDKLVTILKRLFGGEDQKLVINIIISTIPAVIVGGFFADVFAKDDVRSATIVSAMLVSVGLLMMITDDLVKGFNKLKDLKIFSALGIGLAQAIALVPGVSRSGATILAGRYSKLSYKSAAEYSFLIAIPILFGAILRSLFDAETTDLIKNDTFAVVVGITVAFLSGLWAIRFMLDFLKNKGLKYFGVYRIILGLTLLLVVN
jgi:undecaprenyl-diphosphatase